MQFCIDQWRITISEFNHQADGMLFQVRRKLNSPLSSISDQALENVVIGLNAIMCWQWEQGQGFWGVSSFITYQFSCSWEFTIITARVRSTTGGYIFSLSVHTLGGGGTPSPAHKTSTGPMSFLGGTPSPCPMFFLGGWGGVAWGAPPPPPPQPGIGQHRE